MSSVALQVLEAARDLLANGAGLPAGTVVGFDYTLPPEAEIQCILVYFAPEQFSSAEEETLGYPVVHIQEEATLRLECRAPTAVLADEFDATANPWTAVEPLYVYAHTTMAGVVAGQGPLGSFLRRRPEYRGHARAAERGGTLVARHATDWMLDYRFVDADPTSAG